MVNARMLMIAASVMSTAVVAMENKKAIVDMRVFGLEFLHNKQDEHKNTFWHRLAIECETFEDWSEVNKRMEEFKSNNKNWLPNPMKMNVVILQKKKLN